MFLGGVCVQTYQDQGVALAGAAWSTLAPKNLAEHGWSQTRHVKVIHFSSTADPIAPYATHSNPTNPRCENGPSATAESPFS